MLVKSKNSISESVPLNEQIGPRNAQEEAFFAKCEEDNRQVEDSWKRKTGRKSGMRPWAFPGGGRVYERIFGRK